MSARSLRLLFLPVALWASTAAARPPADAGPVATAPQESATEVPPPPTDEEKALSAASEQDVATMKALHAMQACLDAHVKAADDHVSPPEQIAEKIKDACRAEQDQFVAAFKVFAAEHPRVEPPPDRISEADRLAAARAAVIEARKEGR